MIIGSKKFSVSEEPEGFYVTHMSLTIKNFTKADATTYRCVASNSLGETSSSVQVYGECVGRVHKWESRCGRAGVGGGREG